MSDLFEKFSDEIEENTGAYAALGGAAAIMGQQAQRKKLAAIEAQLQMAETRVQKEAIIKRELADFESSVATFSDDPQHFFDINLVNGILNSSGFELSMYGKPASKVTELDSIRFAKKMEEVAKKFATQAYIIKKYQGLISPLVAANYAAFELYSLPFYKVLEGKFERNSDGHCYGREVERFLATLIKTEELNFMKLKDSDISDLKHQFMDSFIQDSASLRIDFSKGQILEVNFDSLASFGFEEDSSELKNQINDFIKSNAEGLVISTKGEDRFFCALARGWIHPYTGASMGNGLLTIYTEYEADFYSEDIQGRMEQLAQTYNVEQEADGGFILCYFKAKDSEEAINYAIEFFAFVHQHADGLLYETSEKSDSNCFIATAVYGDYDHPQVLKLRHFRDSILRKSLLGRYFISFYYTVGPRLAIIPRRSTKIRNLLRLFLDRV